MSTQPTTLLYHPSNPSATFHLTSMINIHIACITGDDHTIATFLPPLDGPHRARLEQWYQLREQEILNGEREIILALIDDQVAGFVMLSMPRIETGPFRGEINKLLVSPDFRRRGVAKMLMSRLEEVAKERGRGLLMVDTEGGSPAEQVYPRLGYKLVGIIPKYEISPLDGSLKDAVFFFKDVRD